MKKAVFIERDGILNEVKVGPIRKGVGDMLIPITIDEFKPCNDVAPFVAKLKQSGFVIIVISHQPGLSRGYQSRRELDRIHEVIKRTFEPNDLMVCPHDDTDHCPCKPPRPGLLIEAAFKWHLNLDHSFVLSKRWEMAEASRTSGCTSVLVKSPWVGRESSSGLIEPDVSSAVEKIIALSTRHS